MKPWQHSLGYGVLWAAAVTASETLSLPFERLSLGSHAVLTLWIFQTWVPTGVALAWFAFAVEQRRLPAWLIALLLVMLAIVLSAMQSGGWWVVHRLGIPIILDRATGGALPSWGNFFYVLWMSLFHGALFSAGCQFAMRAEHTRRLLGDAQLARGRSEALLADAQLDDLRARIDPAFLLHAMAEVQRRYAQDAQDADRLLDQLVGFLRHAMPGVRSGQSTLAAEVGLARTYAELVAEIDPQRSVWRFCVAAGVPRLDFPPLLLLPLLDALTSGREAAGRPELALQAAPNEIVLTLSGVDTARLSRMLRYRFQVALRTRFGAACSVRIEATRLTLRIAWPTPASAESPPIDPLDFSTKEPSYA